jgi:chromosome segregation ATPase
MKRVILLVLTVALTLAAFSATAFAAGGERLGEAAQRAQERADFLNKIQPLIDEVADNRAELLSLKAELASQRSAAAAHLAALKADPDAVTDDQLATAQRLKGEIKDCRASLNNTDTQMKEYRQQLKTSRRSRDYDSVEAAYNGIISLQQQRITLITQLIDLNKQVAAI